MSCTLQDAEAGFMSMMNESPNELSNFIGYSDWLMDQGKEKEAKAWHAMALLEIKPYIWPVGSCSIQDHDSLFGDWGKRLGKHTVPYLWFRKIEINKHVKKIVNAHCYTAKFVGHDLTPKTLLKAIAKAFIELTEEQKAYCLKGEWRNDT